MLTDEQIEQVLYKYTSRQDEFSLHIIRIIAKRLSRLADFDELDTLHREEVMREDITLIKRVHKDYVKKQVQAIKDDFWWIAVVIYMESLKFYAEQTALEANKALMKSINAITQEAQKNLLELLKNPVLVIRDLKTPAVIKAQDLEKAYRSVMNEALTYSNVSNELRDIALKRTETQLFDSGVRYMIDNSSDDARHAIHANNAIRMSVLENAKNLITKMQDVMGKQFGADAVELSAHIYPAPDHAPAQGHQYSLEEVEKMQSGMNFEDLNGTKYIGFERRIGEWNCRHYFMKIKKGAEPTYTQAQLDKILEDNERGYTDENGKHRTLYECTQVQRRYEREIRNAKEKYLYAKELNDKNMMAKARNRVGILTTRYKQFSHKCDLPIKSERIRVKDYK